MAASFSDWEKTFRTLYGEHATRSVFEQHAGVASGSASTPDEWAAIYRDAVRREARHALGEYFTPSWLAGEVLDRVGVTSGATLLDPAAGLGVFVHCAQQRGAIAVGYEVNPITAACARRMGLTVDVRDTLTHPGERRFDFIAGNPPWVNWRRLNPDYRSRIARLWEKYGLIPRGRLGGAMDDLSMLFTYVCADRLLNADGRMALVLSRSLFQSAGGGREFRRFELPGGRFLRVDSVHEVDGTSAFAGASTQAVIAVFEVADAPTAYPVAYFRRGREFQAQPVSSDHASAWMIADWHGRHERMRGESAYVARVGAHSGGASGVFWVDELERNEGTVLVRNRHDAGRNDWPSVIAEVEPGLLRRLVRGRDVSANAVAPSCSILLPHSENGAPVSIEEMRRCWPLTYAYFEQFRERMLERPHYRQHFAKRGFPYWSMYNVGAYTFARWRVVWREQHSTLRCAAIGRQDWIADAKLVVVPCGTESEARYLAALLNSRPAREFVDSYAVKIQISTHVLRYLRVPKFDAADPLHAALAECGDAVRADEFAEELWGLRPGAVRVE